jgi:hypothetical protein
MVKEGTLIGILAIVAVIAVIGLGASLASLSVAGEFKGALRVINKSATPYPLGYSCSDTDGGVNYYTRGTVSGRGSNGSYTYTDFCFSGSGLTEYYCAFGNTSYSEPSSVNYNCPYGCSNGTCQEQQEWCQDFDGFDPWTSSWVNASNGVFVDTCIGSNTSNSTLLEGVCTNNQGDYTEIDCAIYGVSCTDGRCYNGTGNSTT